MSEAVREARATIEAPPETHTRRGFLAHAGAAAAAGLAGLLGYGAAIEPYRCEATERDVPIEGLPKAFDGFRICHIADIHHGPLIGIESVRAALASVADRRPDVIAVPGDFTSGAEYTTAVAEAVGDLRAPHGVVWTPGNHDHWGSLPELRRVLGRKGAADLTNRSIEVRRGEARLVLAGVDDLWEGEPDAARALRGVDPDRTPVVVLAHNPDALHGDRGVPALLDARPALVLAGHTHGGQVVLPGVGPLGLPIKHKRYASGLFRVGRTAMYVTRGVGLWGGIRINCPPEVAYLTLRAA